MSEAAPADRPLFKPPVLFLGALLLGTGVDRLVAVPLGLGGLTPRLAAALPLFGLGTGLAAWGIATLRRHGTTLEPGRVPSALVVTGPYRFSRNPLYVALVFALVAFAALLDSLAVLFAVPVLAAALDRHVVRREERVIARRFGAAYEAYRARVRRWI